MHKDLVLNAFEKAKRDAKEATGVNMSVTGLSKIISDYMMEECHFQYHEKSLRNKYKLALKKDEDEEVELKSSVANCLCCYLGYENYAEFILNKNQQENSAEVMQAVAVEEEYKEERIVKKESSIREKIKIIIHKNKVTLIFLCVVFVDLFQIA